MKYDIVSADPLQTTDLFLVSILLHLGIVPRIDYIDRTVLFGYDKPSSELRGIFADFTYGKNAPKSYQNSFTTSEIKEIRKIYDTLRGQVIDWMKTGKEINLSEN